MVKAIDFSTLKNSSPEKVVRNPVYTSIGALSVDVLQTQKLENRKQKKSRLLASYVIENLYFFK